MKLLKLVKGSIPDMLEIMVFVFILGIVLLTINLVWDEAVPELELILGETGQDVVASGALFFDATDYMFVFFSFGLGIAAIVLAYMSQFNPIFFWISIIIIAINLLLAPVFSNVMREMFLQDDFSVYESQYPLMVFIFQYFPHFITVISTLMSIVMFARGRMETSRGGL